MFETSVLFVELLTSIVFDTRFQVVVLMALFLHWNYRLPRPMRAAVNKTVFITGCDSGMGHRMAKHFDEMKMHVFAGCLNPEGSGAKALKKDCSQRLHIVPLDVTKEDQIKEAVAYVKANIPHGERGLYCLVNNAGVLPYTAFELLTTQMCEEVININLMGAVRMTKHFLPLIVETQGRIITITSIMARLSFPHTTIYTATKHALDGFFSSLRFELKDRGVHIATVEPGNFSRTTNIMQWTQNHVEEMWKNLSPEEKHSKLHMYEATKKRIDVQQDSPQDQEKVYKFLLNDVEDAMLAEEPHFRYVSAPLTSKLALWFLRTIPSELAFKLTSSKILK